ncbi:hypothetical protein HRbin30_00107 [bacterium HR30]|nr:hypothetical protein HRbin30_00107 [bacterium HR30]
MDWAGHTREVLTCLAELPWRPPPSPGPPAHPLPVVRRVGNVETAVLTATAGALRRQRTMATCVAAGTTGALPCAPTTLFPLYLWERGIPVVPRVGNMGVGFLTTVGVRVIPPAL